jgi:hypothetical protein
LPPGDYFVQAFVNVYSAFKRADGHTVWMHDDFPRMLVVTLQHPNPYFDDSYVMARDIAGQARSRQRSG